MAFFSLKLFSRPQPFSPPRLHLPHCSSARKGICLSEKHTAMILKGGTAYFLFSGVPRCPVTHADTHLSLSHSGRAEVCCSEKLGRMLHTPPQPRQSWGSRSLAIAYPSEPERAHYKCMAPFVMDPTDEYTCLPIFWSEPSFQLCTLPAQNGFALRLLPYDSAQAATE